MLGDSDLSIARGYLTTVVEERNAAGDDRVHLIEFPIQQEVDGYGCDWHPSLSTHQKMADRLAQAIRAALGW